MFPFLFGEDDGGAIGMGLSTAALIAVITFGMFVLIVAVVALFGVIGLHHRWQRAHRGAKSNWTRPLVLLALGGALLAAGAAVVPSGVGWATAYDVRQRALLPAEARQERARAHRLARETHRPYQPPDPACCAFETGARVGLRYRRAQFDQFHSFDALDAEVMVRAALVALGLAASAVGAWLAVWEHRRPRPVDPLPVGARRRRSRDEPRPRRWLRRPAASARVGVAT